MKKFLVRWYSSLTDSWYSAEYLDRREALTVQIEKAKKFGKTDLISFEGHRPNLDGNSANYGDSYNQSITHYTKGDNTMGKGMLWNHINPDDYKPQSVLADDYANQDLMLLGVRLLEGNFEGKATKTVFLTVYPLKDGVEPFDIRNSSIQVVKLCEDILEYPQGKEELLPAVIRLIQKGKAWSMEKGQLSNEQFVQLCPNVKAFLDQPF